MNRKYIMELRKFVSPEIVCGVDARLLIGKYMVNFGAERPMIVTDTGASGQKWFADIISEISTKVEKITIFSSITPNPKDFEVMAGTKEYLENKCDLLIAIGGGSPIDCAKCIAVLSSNGGQISDYYGVDRVMEPGPPLICIPSTAGSSADVSQFAIILDSEQSVKKAIISKMVVPDLALIDPVPLLTEDSYLAACTGLDALTHAIEAYVSNAGSNLTDVWALEAIKLISGNLENAISSGAEIENVYPVMLGSLQAGLAFSNASLGAVHAMAHSLGGLLNLAHGECNAILLGPVIEENFDCAAEQYTNIAEAMGIDVSKRNKNEVKSELISRISLFRRNLGIRDRIEIKNYSIYEPRLISSALLDPCMVTNPKAFTATEVSTIYGKIINPI